MLQVKMSRSEMDRLLNYSVSNASKCCRKEKIRWLKVMEGNGKVGGVTGHDKDE